MATEMEGLRQQMLKMQEDHANDMAALRAQLAEATGRPPIVMQAAEKQEDAEKKMERLRAEIEAGQQAIEAELLKGPRMFEVSCPTQRMLTKRVGGENEDVARVKYERYSGITAIMDPKVKIKVVAVDPADDGKTEQRKAA